MDSVLYARYIKSSKEGDQLCDSSSYYDSLILFYKNITHIANTVQLKIISQTDESLSNESVVIRNLYIYVDTCDRSCATCNGPAAVSFSLNFKVKFQKTSGKSKFFSRSAVTLERINMNNN